MSTPTFVAVGAYSAPRGRHAAPHHYAAWKVTLYRSGHIDALIDGVPYQVGPGTILTIPPHLDHAEVAHTAYSNYYLLLDAQPDLPWPRVAVDSGTERLGSALAALVSESSTVDEHSPTMVDSLVNVVDVTLRRLAADRTPSRARTIVNAVEQLLEERYGSRCLVADLAREVGVSTSTLRAMFGAELGRSPQERLREIRLHHAVELLQTSNLTLAAVATRCGYHSASHLTRHLKQALGRTPGALRAP